MQFDGPLRIGVARHQQPLAHADARRQAPPTARARGRPPAIRRLALAAGKLPCPARCVPFSRRVSRKRAVALDDCRRDDDHSIAELQPRPPSCALRRASFGRRQACGLAVRAHRTLQAPRLARRAERRAEIHQRLVEVEDVLAAAPVFRQGPQLRIIAWLFGSPRADERRGTARARRSCRESRRARGTRSCGSRRPCSGRGP